LKSSNLTFFNQYESRLYLLAAGFTFFAVSSMITYVHVRHLDGSLGEIVRDLEKYSNKIEASENPLAKGLYVDVYNHRVKEYRTLLNTFPNQLLNDWFLGYPKRDYLLSHMLEEFD
jgi:hypothetical protein